MISLLLSEPRASGAPSQSEPPPSQTEMEAAEFEIVVGRRQIASISLVMVVLLAVFSGISYLIGKTAFAETANTAPAAVEPIPPVPAPSVEQAQSPPQPQADPQPSQSPQPAKTPDAETLDAPLFDYPVPGAVYIQVGAVERALCRVWAEGLRTHGLRAFVAPGPNDKLYRVLIGPLPDPDAYKHAKDVLDRIGLATFGRRYQI